MNSTTAASGTGQRGVVATLAFSMLLASLGISIVAISLPDLVIAFDSTLAGAQWVILSYLLAITVTTVPIGRLSDEIGLKPVLLMGLSLFTLASIGCALAPNLWALVGLRAVQGMAAAALMTLPISAVRHLVPPEKTGSVMGLLGTVSAVGTALGPSLGGVLIDGFGWNSVFFALAVGGGLTTMLYAATTRAGNHQNAASPRRRQDVAGLLLLVAVLGGYSFAMTVDAFSAPQFLLLVASLAGLLIFIRLEKHAANPIVDLRLFSQPALTTGALANTLVSTIMMATLIVGPFFLMFGLGLSNATSGLIMAIGPVTAAFSGVPAGRLTDRFGPSAMMVAGLMQMVAGALALAWLPVMFAVPGFIVAFMLLTPGYQLFLAAVNTHVLNGADAKQRGVVSGIMTLSRNLGFLTGASLMGALFAGAVGISDPSLASPDAIATGLTATYLVAALLAALALVLTLYGNKAPLGGASARGTPVSK
ncbi:MAG: MFS transporter [Pseudomonadota bacterium]